MRRYGRISLRLFGVLFMLLALTLVQSACSRKESLDPSTMPENVRADYTLFARRCSKCHTLARPLNANITDDEQWVFYVNRMRRQPSSGISLRDQEQILRFLRWYAGDLRRIAAEKSGSAAPSSAAPALPPSTEAGAP